jgi:ribonuclease T1
MLRTRRPLLALLALVVLLGAGYLVRALDSGSSSKPGVVAASALPVQARQTIALIQQGGPFPYRQDGSVFQNRGNVLPKKPTGYYHEYTVPTPGSADRGARRIVAARDGTFYYTSDHYNSFRRVELDK